MCWPAARDAGRHAEELSALRDEAEVGLHQSMAPSVACVPGQLLLLRLGATSMHLLRRDMTLGCAKLRAYSSALPLISSTRMRPPNPSMANRPCTFSLSSVNTPEGMLYVSRSESRYSPCVPL